ncbi:MAG: hypothetical protein N2248_06830 [candidate division WOR-3 bacterium]|uniref:DNA-directed RNA polymerase subunit omega n=1 Tax=candidate division WOR-3 bacterium TaxID=2052148 RepID=A0A7C3INX6_UNCW3|nr:hypothetical protein [candidate division WOR-3 bacterium]
MKFVSIEQLWHVYPNKYLALNIAALETRRLIDAISRDEIQLPTNPYEYALHRLLRGELKYAPLTEAELEALNANRLATETRKTDLSTPSETGITKIESGSKPGTSRTRS